MGWAGLRGMSVGFEAARVSRRGVEAAGRAGRREDGEMWRSRRGDGYDGGRGWSLWWS